MKKNPGRKNAKKSPKAGTSFNPSAVGSVKCQKFASMKDTRTFQADVINNNVNKSIPKFIKQNNNDCKLKMLLMKHSCIPIYQRGGFSGSFFLK